MRSSSTKEKSLLNYHIRYSRVSMLFLISITLVSSSLYVLPLAYSQEFSSYILANPKYGTRTGMVSWPSDLAVDQEGNVYVADTANNRIQIFSSNGTFIARWGNYGVGNGTLRYPQSIAVDQEGNVYVADTG